MQRIRITAKKYPAIFLSPSLSYEDWLSKILIGNWAASASVPKEAIGTCMAVSYGAQTMGEPIYISDSFLIAAYKAKDKLYCGDIIEQLITHVDDVFYAALLIDNLTIYTAVWVKENSFHVSTTTLQGLYVMGHALLKFDLTSDGVKLAEHDFGDSYAYIALYVFLFKRFADIETKTVAPRQKTSFGSVSLKNDSGKPVVMLSSNWFTNIVSDSPFWVRGHFRLQPYGEGMKQRKLIFIDPFEKNGYTRKADILTPTKQ